MGCWLSRISEGDPRRRAHDRRMRRLLGGSALVTIIVSALILFVLARGTLDFLRSIGWNFGILRDLSEAPGWFLVANVLTYSRFFSGVSSWE